MLGGLLVDFYVAHGASEVEPGPARERVSVFNGGRPDKALHLIHSARNVGSNGAKNHQTHSLSNMNSGAAYASMIEITLAARGKMSSSASVLS